jgi:dienelactone hydrolase
VGVITEPDAADAHPDRPAVLMWNVGINHRVGPFRFNVDVARKLAQLGFTVLRFDVSGLGDSEVRKETINEFERAALDVQEAMNALQAKRRVRRFVLIGFCSSVDAAHVVALRDERVVGVAYLESYVWRTPGYYLRYPLRFISPARWQRLLARRFPALFPTYGGGLQDDRESVYLRDRPSMEKFATDVRLMVRRGVQLMFVYVSGDNPFTHKGQFFEMVGGHDLAGKVRVEFYKDADHTFFLLRDRARLIYDVCDWARTWFGQVAAEPRRVSG